MKLGVAVLAGGIDPVENKAVKVGVSIQRVPKPLHKRDGAALGRVQTQRFLRTAAQFPEQSTNEDVQHIAQEGCVVGQTIPKRKRQREDPLTYGNDWKYTIDKVRRRVCHPPACTRRTPNPPLATERQKPVVTATLTPET
jgi:hypothetical protein